MLKEFFPLMSDEIILTLILFVILFIKTGTSGWSKKRVLGWVNAMLLANFVCSFLFSRDGSAFGEMFRSSGLLSLEKSILNGGTLLISLQAYSWLMDHDHVEEFYVLLLSTLLGMFFMISASNLLMFYLALELSTIPLAALANFDLGKRRSSEAAIKFIISSAFSSGLLLFGISLIYGTTGTLGYAGISEHLDHSPLQLFAFILVIAGFAFKISIVPFHLWTADVYEGAPISVTAYLSVISKGAILFVLVQVLYTVFRPLGKDWYHFLVLLSIVTMLVGNLFAIRQRNIKRLLAFSSIAQIGFILVGLSGNSQMGSTSVIYFVLVYLLSNLGAFGVASLVSSLKDIENIDQFRGMYLKNPLLAWSLAISLFSLAGIPPTAGFFGKFFLLMAGAGQGNYFLIVTAALNMIISLYYYLKVVQAVFSDAPNQPMEKLSVPILPKLALLLCCAGVLSFGLLSPIYDYIYSLTATF
jgi:NADH-quinone oxidoreductase subunit N